MIKGEYIIKINRKTCSFLQDILLLSLIILFFRPEKSVAQVISNNGATISLTTGVVVNSKDAINAPGGTLSNFGTINLSGNFTNTATTNGDGIFRIGGNWTNTGGTFIPGLSTVVFNGLNNQSIIRTGGETFHNLSIENSGASSSNKVSLSNNVTVTDTLSMLTGNMDATSYKLLLSNQAPSSLKYKSVTGSRIFGKFERGINQKGTYLFPMGTSAYYNPANLITNSLPSPGTVLSEFLTSPPPGNAGLPLFDPPVEVDSTYTDGYWSLTANNGFSIGDYSINLNGSGFTIPILDITRVVKRIATGDWTLDGVHSDADTIQNVVYRNNLTQDISPSGTQYALVRANPLITSHPQPLIVCEKTNPVFSITATTEPNAGPLTYRWYKVPGTALSDGARYSGAKTNTLTIKNAVLSDAGYYYCVVKDRHRNTSTSNSAQLIVTKIPVATATPILQGQACSIVPFTSIVLGESYGVPGTTFNWIRNVPTTDSITTNVPVSGNALNIGDVISGYFTNLTDAPITITFSITPIGPTPTFCIGNTIYAKVIVNPIPRATPFNLNNFKPDSSICFAGTTSLHLASPTLMTSGTIIFDYTVSVTGGPGWVTGCMTGKTNRPPADTITRPYRNISDTLQSVYYSITPKVDNAVCAPGPILVSEIKIHPQPNRRIVMVKPLTCEGGSDATLSAVTSKGVDPFRFLWEEPFNHKDTILTIKNKPGGIYRLTITDNLGCFNSRDTSVTGAFIDTYLLIYPKSTGYGITCPGYNDGKLLLGVNSGGAPIYQYWITRNSKDTSTALIHGTLSAAGIYKNYQNLYQGEYTLSIKDANGCFDNNSTQTITEPDIITVIFGKKQYTGGFNVSCKTYSDGKAWIKTITGGNGGYIYQWRNSGGTIIGTSDTISGLTAGKYYLRTTDSQGCTKPDSLMITEPEGMGLSSVQLKTSPDGNFNISCNGYSDGKITLNITGGSGIFEYHWSRPVGDTITVANEISGLKAGHYKAVVADVNGCTLAALDTMLTQPAVLNAVSARSLAPDNINNINCFGGTGWINLTVTGGSIGNYRYDWSTISNGSGIIAGRKDQPALTSGTYRLVVSDTNLCTTAKDITLTEPQPLVTTLVPTHITCFPAGYSNGSINLTVSGGVAPYLYNWSNGASTKDINNLTQGYYNVNVTDMNGCPKTDTVKINLPPKLTYDSLLKSFNNYNISCWGSSDGEIHITPVTGKPPYIYNWSGLGGSFVSVNQNITGLKAGQYNLQITDSNFCTTTGTFNLSQPGKLSMTIVPSASALGGFNINCAGASTGSINITPVNNVGTVNYLWSDGATGRLRTYIPAGTYKVALTDQNGCQADSTVILTQPDSIKIKFSVKLAYCPDSPDGEIHITVKGGVIVSDYAYKWSDKSTSQDITNILRGLYKVTVTDANDCSVQDSIKMEPLNKTCLTIPNAITPNDDNINDVWNIDRKELYPQIEIKIFNRWGELIWKSEKGYPKPWDGRSNGVRLPIDSYHYIIDLHNGSKPIVGNITIMR